MSAIAKDAAITLITAPPGSGKTLRVVWYIREALKAGEQVFVCNLNGLVSTGEFAGWVPFDDPAKWEQLPPGAVLVVDEAQQFFRAATGHAPAYITAMETIRHRGIRLILITQHPALLHSNIRALIGRHEHLVRENGKTSAIVYRRNSVIDNVRSDSALRREDSSTWSYPTELYDAYNSAEVHTVKRVITSRAKKAAVLIVVSVALIAGIVYRVNSKMQANASNPDSAVPASISIFGASGSALPKPRTAAEYADQFTPVIPSMPWTMPATMQRDVLVQPKIYCMSSELFCNCLTEQGTRHRLADSECRDIARNGPPYNPFLDPLAVAYADVVPPQPVVSHGVTAPIDQPRAVVPASTSRTLGYGQMASYGDHALAPPGTHSIGDR